MDVCARLKLVDQVKGKNKMRKKKSMTSFDNASDKTKSINNCDDLDEDKVWGHANHQENATFYLLTKGYDSLDIE